MRAAEALFFAFVTQLGASAVGMVLRVMNSRYGWRSDLEEVVLGCILYAFLASILALMAWPFAWLLLRHKEKLRAVRHWFLTACLLAALVSLWPLSMAALLMTPFVSLAGAIITAIRLPMVFTTPGLCFKCGYDLTGNVSGVCPECGRPIVRAS